MGMKLLSRGVSPSLGCTWCTPGSLGVKLRTATPLSMAVLMDVEGDVEGPLVRAVI